MTDKIKLESASHITAGDCYITEGAKNYLNNDTQWAKPQSVRTDNANRTATNDIGQNDAKASRDLKQMMRLSS